VEQLHFELGVKEIGLVSVMIQADCLATSWIVKNLKL